MRRILFLWIFTCTVSFGQTTGKFTISGYIKDASNGEALIGATVYVTETQGGGVTNEYGFYSITLPAATYTLHYSYLGYLPITKSIQLDKNNRIDIELSGEAEQLQEVVIQAELEQANVQNLEMSTNKLDIKTIQRIPAFLGEADVIKSLQLLPGVSTVGEGAAGFNVRGGSVGQNLILLDEAPVYNSSHLLGFFSVFNPDAVKDVKLYKGGIPARYGGRLSSLLDVRMKEGNSKKWEVTGGIGTIFSRIAIEAPIVKDKASFIVAARRSYIDVLARPFAPILQNGGALNFYDVTMKANYNINPKNRVYLSGYFGRDNFKFDRNQGFSWGNATATLRWNHIFNDRLFSNFTALYSNYDYSLAFGRDDRNSFKWNSLISNYIFKPQFTYFLNSNNELNFGAEVIYYNFDPANAVGVSEGEAKPFGLNRKYNLESSLYLSNSQKISKIFTIDYGIRYSLFNAFGPDKTYTYNDAVPGVRRDTVSSRQYKSGEVIAAYGNFEPRVSFKVQANPTSSIKGSYNRMAQYLHLISNTTASNPLDVWNPSSKNIKPQLADQYTLGFFKDLGKSRTYELSVEGYWKNTQNQIDYIDGADLLINEFLEGDLLSGEGRAYGIETYFQKKAGRLTGWVSYTLARTELKVNGINQGNWYPTRFDQTHNLKIAAFYDISKRWSFSANFVYTSGTPTTFPTSRYISQGLLIPYNGNDSRNNVTLPDYHRLDVSFRLEGKKQKRGKDRKNSDYWVFGVYNLYARQNPFSIYFSQADQRVSPGQPISSEATQLSIIGTVVPSISYNFKF
ncbi:MAG: TonB-dependent receptor [Cytophagales bacterium]|nr:TonB-dependent receptor [Cytophagales bacterium]MCA6388049.1 TonB-dependent receptor [Cytophagales bacterium]MCA6391078.1 TonB-dependent receptor [Cytophagales bacterium]MCA6394799.1 TonB-dependent receptor [Cytophagales bacterium]MCA6399822.1 TonB-dependent receptor [Cytophagales bacterium]